MYSILLLQYSYIAIILIESMTNTDNSQPSKHLIVITAIATILIILVLVFFSWLLSRGVENPDDNVPVSEQQVENTPAIDSSNPNIENGASGADNTKSIPLDGTAP